jgi:hypothetical protein
MLISVIHHPQLEQVTLLQCAPRLRQLNFKSISQVWVQVSKGFPVCFPLSSSWQALQSYLIDIDTSVVQDSSLDSVPMDSHVVVDLASELFLLKIDSDIERKMLSRHLFNVSISTTIKSAWLWSSPDPKSKY